MTSPKPRLALLKEMPPYGAAQASLEISQATRQRYVGMVPQNLDSSNNFGRLISSTLQAALAEAEIGHPATLMSKAAIRAAQATSDGAQAAFGPTATINGSVRSRWSGPAGSLGDGFSGSVGISITVPLYAGGALGANVRRANIEQIKYEVDAMSAYEQIREAVISAWAGIQSADPQILAVNSSAVAGRTVIDGVIEERESGRRTTLDVINARAELTTAREGVITASNNKVLATFSLLSAMGQLTAIDLGLNVEV